MDDLEKRARQIAEKFRWGMTSDEMIFAMMEFRKEGTGPNGNSYAEGFNAGFQDAREKIADLFSLKID